MKVEIDKNKVVHSYVDWYEVVQKYKSLFAGDEIMESSHGKQWQKTLKEGYEQSFYGASSDEMLERLKKGYPFPVSKLGNMPVVTYDRPRSRYTDDAEGEFDYDMFINGETDCFLSKPKRQSVGGIRMKVQIGFVARTPDRVITEYFAWVGKVIQAIQARGYDIELSVFNQNNKLYPNYRGSYQNIRISKFGEKIMPKDWSALFSPGGHRHYMFLIYQWTGEQEDIAYSAGLGSSEGKGWELEWDRKERMLTIHVNSMAREFPAEHMTEQLENWND